MILIPSRRQLLKGVSAGLALALLNRPFAGTGLAMAPAARKLLVGSGYDVCIVDLISGAVRIVPLRLIPHSFVQYPARPDKVWVIERGYDKAYERGGAPVSAAEVDLAAGRVLRYITPPDNSRFFGHGFFTPDGEVLFISRVDMEGGNGYLTGYGRDGKIAADFCIAQGAVHDVRLLADGTVLAANSGIKPLVGLDQRLNGPRVAEGALLHIDLQSGKVLDKQYVVDDRQMLGHFHKMEDDTIIALSRPRPSAGGEPGKVFKGKRGDASLRQVSYTETVKPGLPGECLSVAVNEKGHRALITNPENKRILVMDTRAGVFTGEISGSARGVVFDETNSQFIASGDTISLIDSSVTHARAWMPSAGPEHQTSSFNGAHSFLI